MADRLLMISKGRQKLYGAVNDIRERFALHAIIVEGQGQWASLPGVVSVEPANNGQGPERMLLRLAENTTPDDVLASIASAGDMHIRRFEQAVPSLSDIFIEVAEADDHA